MTTEDGDDLADMIMERVDSNTPAPCHAVQCSRYAISTADGISFFSAQVWNSPVGSSNNF